MTNDSNRRNRAGRDGAAPADGEAQVLRRGQNPAGQVEADSRGNSVWRWRSSADVESTSCLLRQLENEELSLEPTQRVPVPGKTWERGDSSARRKPPISGPGPAPGKNRDERARAPAGGLALTDEGAGNKGSGGFDPYNNG